MTELLSIAFLAAVVANGFISCAMPWWPRADSVAPLLGRLLLIGSPIALFGSVLGWFQPGLPLLLGAGAYLGAVVLGLVIAVVTVRRNPDLTEDVTIEQLLKRFRWYGPVYVAFALVQVVGGGAGLGLLLSSARS